MAGSEPTCGFWEVDPGLLLEQHVLSTAESALQPQMALS